MCSSEGNNGSSRSSGSSSSYSGDVAAAAGGVVVEVAGVVVIVVRTRLLSQSSADPTVMIVCYHCTGFIMYHVLLSATNVTLCERHYDQDTMLLFLFAGFAHLAQIFLQLQNLSPER